MEVKEIKKREAKNNSKCACVCVGVSTHAQSCRRCLYGYIYTAKSRPRAPPNHRLTPPHPPLSLSPKNTTLPLWPGLAWRSISFPVLTDRSSPARKLTAVRARDRLFVRPPGRRPGDRREAASDLPRADDAGRVDAGAAASHGPLRLLPGRRRRGLVLAAAGLDGGREQAVRAGAGRPGPRLPVPGLGEGGARHGEDGDRGQDPLQGPRGRRAPDRERHGALPRLRTRRRGGRGCRGLYAAVGRRQRRGARRGLPARVPVRRREAPRRPHAGAGTEEGRAVDRGRAQVVPARTEEVRQRGLEEHLAQLRADADADAGGQPRAEVLHQAQLGGRQGQEEVEHPRHHHRAPHRRPATLAVPVIHDHQPVQRARSQLSSDRAVLAAMRREAATTRWTKRAVQFTDPDSWDAEFRHGFARSRPAVWPSA